MHGNKLMVLVLSITLSALWMDKQTYDELWKTPRLQIHEKFVATEWMTMGMDFRIAMIVTVSDILCVIYHKW